MSVRAKAPSIPDAGNGSDGENALARIAPEGANTPEDALKVQWYHSDRFVVYQFVSDGSLILQVSCEQMLNLASQISQALVQEAANEALTALRRGK